MLFLPLRWTERIAAAGQRRWSFLLVGMLFNHLNALLHYVRTSLSSTAYGSKLKILVEGYQN